MNLNDEIPYRILVAGAGGHLGRRVVQILHDQGVTDLVAASRDLSKLQEFADQGIALRRADYNNPDMLQTAFAGVDRLLLISTDELQTPGLRIRQHQNAIRAAEAAGIRHIVYTSMPNPVNSTAISFAHDHVATEQALIESGLGYTILRVSWYSENLRGYLPQIIQAGTWPTAAGDGRVAFVPREDVARVTAAALLSESESNVYDITGAEALTITGIAEAIRNVFGRQINVKDVSTDQIQKELQGIGIPDAFIPTVVMTDLNTKAGHFDVVTNTIERLTGKSPQSLKSFLQENASRFITID